MSDTTHLVVTALGLRPIVIATLAIFVLLPASAGAATEVRVYGPDPDLGRGEIIVSAGGVDNELRVGLDRRRDELVVTDSERITIGYEWGDCDRLSRTSIRCEYPRGAETDVFGSGGDDRLRISRTMPRTHLYGGEGQDRIFGGAKSDSVLGGEHADVIYGRGGNDTLSGDEGSGDRLYGGADNDDVALRDGRGDFGYGGPGNDKLSSGREREKIMDCGRSGDRAIFQRGNPTEFERCERLEPY